MLGLTIEVEKAYPSAYKAFMPPHWFWISILHHIDLQLLFIFYYLLFVDHYDAFIQDGWPLQTDRSRLHPLLEELFAPP